MPLSAAVQTGARCVQCLRNEVLFSDRWDRGGAGKIDVSVDGGCVYINTNTHINSRNQAYLYMHIISLCKYIFFVFLLVFMQQWFFWRSKGNTLHRERYHIIKMPTRCIYKSSQTSGWKWSTNPLGLFWNSAGWFFQTLKFDSPRCSSLTQLYQESQLGIIRVLPVFLLPDS